MNTTRVRVIAAVMSLCITYVIFNSTAFIAFPYGASQQPLAAAGAPRAA